MRDITSKIPDETMNNNFFMTKAAPNSDQKALLQLNYYIIQCNKYRVGKRLGCDLQSHPRGVFRVVVFIFKKRKEKASEELQYEKKKKRNVISFSDFQGYLGT